MATIEDMVEVVNNVSPCRFSCVVTDLLYQALRDAELEDILRSVGV